MHGRRLTDRPIHADKGGATPLEGLACIVFLRPNVQRPPIIIIIMNIDKSGLASPGRISPMQHDINHSRVRHRCVVPLVFNERLIGASLGIEGDEQSGMRLDHRSRKNAEHDSNSQPYSPWRLPFGARRQSHVTILIFVFLLILFDRNLCVCSPLFDIFFLAGYRCSRIRQIGQLLSQVSLVSL